MMEAIFYPDPYIFETAKMLLLAGFLGFVTVLINSYYKNYWLRQKNTLIMAWILPATSLIITKVIATNFALSLGMIGALSIIRYRTPVKSNFELALLFGLVTLGITTGINAGLACVLAVFISLIPITIIVLQKIFPGFFLSLPYTSEGKVECTIQGAFEHFDQIAFPKNVLKSIDISKTLNQDAKTFIATGIFANMNEAKDFSKQFETQHAISSFSLREI